MIPYFENLPLERQAYYNRLTERVIEINIWPLIKRIGKRLVAVRICISISSGVQIVSLILLHIAINGQV